MGYFVVVEVETVLIEEAPEEGVALANRVPDGSEIGEGSKDFIETLLVLELIQSAEVIQHFLHLHL
jgi:hypothetical protein